MYRKYSLISFIFILCLALTSCDQGNSKGTGNEEASIRKSVESYEKAFNDKNSEALASLWVEDADYTNPETGAVIKGRKALEEQFREEFAENKQDVMKINIESISFPNPNEAIEIGTATVTAPNEKPVKAIYKAIYKKIDGKWFLAKVNEVDVDDPQTNYDHLKKIEWLIGDWIDEDEDSTIITSAKWDRYKNFITQRFTVTIEGSLDLEGIQIIGWDPIEDQIRSWIFDSDGGFGEGDWRQEGNKWIVETNSTLADGRKASSVNTYIPIDDNSYRWNSTGREVGGELQPDIDFVTVTRKKG